METRRSNYSFWMFGLLLWVIVLCAYLFRLYQAHLAGYLVATDGVDYLVIAKSLMSHGSYPPSLGRSAFMNSPGYPFAVILAGNLTGDLEAAGIMVSVIGGLLATLCVYATIHKLRHMDDLIPAWAPFMVGLLFGLHPVMVTLCTQVLADGLYMAFLWAGIFLWTSAHADNRPALLWPAFLALGLAYLVKPEGLPYFVLVWALEIIASRRCLRIETPKRAWLVGLTMFILTVGPYVAWISLKTGAFALSGKAAAWLYGHDAERGANHVMLNYSLDPNGHMIAIPAPELHPLSWRELLRRWLRNLWPLWKALQEILPFQSHWLSVLGAAWLAFRKGRIRWPRAALCLLLPLVLLPFIIIFPRLLVSGLPILLAFAICAPLPILKRIGRGQAVACTLFGLLCLGLVINTFILDRPRPVPSGLRAGADWLHGHINPGDPVVAGKPQIPYYSGGSFLPLPYAEPQPLVDYMRHYNARWLVLFQTDLTGRPMLDPIWRGNSPNFVLSQIIEVVPRSELRIFSLEPDPKANAS